MTSAPITLKTLKLLTLVEHAPKYGQQMCRLAPDIFTGKQRSLTGVVHDTRVYIMLNRVVGLGYLKRLANYVPPASMEIPKDIAGRVVWYAITAQGRAALREARAVLLNGDTTNA